MPNKSKQKGDREERAVVKEHLEMGYFCQRTLESGARNEGDTWDIDLHLSDGSVLSGECKMRKDGFKEIYKHKGNADLLTIRANNKERLYVINEDLWFRLLTNL